MLVFALSLLVSVVTHFSVILIHLFCSFTLSYPTPTHLLFGQLQQLFLGLLHLTSRPSDGDLVRAGALGGEMDVDATTVFHDGAHEAALGADQRVV